MKLIIVIAACLTLLGCGFPIFHEVTERLDAAGNVTSRHEVTLTDPHAFVAGSFDKMQLSANGALMLQGVNSKPDVQDLITLANLILAMRGVAMQPVVVPTTQP